MYATDDQVGTKIKCPDCGHRNLARPREKKQQKKEVMVPDGDEYQLDESFAPPPTPQFTPIEQREAQFRAAARERASTARSPVNSEPSGDNSADQTRPGAVAEQRRTAAPPSPAPAESTERGKRRTLPTRDPKRPLVPVVQGVARMVFTSEVAVRWVGLSLVLTAVLFLVLQVLGAMGNQALYMLPLFAGGCMLAGIWVMSAAPLFITIITESSDGNDELYDPPSWLSFDVAEAGFLVIAAMTSALPAWLATKAAVGLPLEARLAIGAGAWMLLFPFVVLSALEQGSAFAIVSPRLATSLVRCFVPWATFYIASMALAAGAAKLAEYLFTRGSFAALLPIPWVIVALIIVYMRMIGRLGWWIADSMPPPAEVKEE